MLPFVIPIPKSLVLFRAWVVLCSKTDCKKTWFPLFSDAVFDISVTPLQLHYFKYLNHHLFSSNVDNSLISIKFNSTLISRVKDYFNVTCATNITLETQTHKTHMAKEWYAQHHPGHCDAIDMCLISSKCVLS